MKDAAKKFRKTCEKCNKPFSTANESEVLCRECRMRDDFAKRRAEDEARKEADAKSNEVFETRKCVDCGHEFDITNRDRDFFESHGYSLPNRCPECRKIHRDFVKRGLDNIGLEDTCADCGQKLQFTNRELYWYVVHDYKLPTRCKACREKRNPINKRQQKFKIDIPLSRKRWRYFCCQTSKKERNFMSMPISVCNDTFKINNVVFLPTKDVKKENHTIWVLEYSDNAVFIVDASTWDEIDEVIKETIRDMHSENAVLKRISSFTNLQDSHGLVMQEGRLGEIAKHFDLETIYPYANGWYFGENLYLANGDAWDGNNIYKVTVDSGLAWPMNVIVRALNSCDAVDKAVDFLHAESMPGVQDVCDVTEDESKEYEDGGYGIYGNHGSCYAGVSHESKHAMASVLYSAYVNKLPLLLMGPSSKEIADTLSLSVTGKYANQLQCDGPCDIGIIRESYKSTGVLVVTNAFGSDWMISLLQELNQAKCLIVFVHPFIEDISIEASSLYSYCCPISTVDTVDNLADMNGVTGACLSDSFEAYVPTVKGSKRADELMAMSASKLFVRNLAYIEGNAASISGNEADIESFVTENIIEPYKALTQN